jgi:acetyl-CoA/propionyl-CoA carboxylase biotin carboxyl carrier protein
VTAVGHAIEFRINAEDPFSNFTPSPGTITEYREPSGIGVRVDGWVHSGTKVSQFYDNLVAKLIVWASDRDQAIDRGRRALQEYEIHGIATTIPAHLQVLAHEDFRADRHHTKWIEDEVTLVDPGPVPSEVLPAEEDLERRSMTIEVGGKRFDVAYWASSGGGTGGGSTRRKRPKLEKATGSGSADGIIAAPMQGTIVKVSVKAGDTVEAGDPICVLEAMKMENEVTAPHSGAVTDLRVQPGDTVSPGETIAIIK